MGRKLSIGVVMDPIHAINPVKDTTLGLLLAAQKRGHRIAYMERCGFTAIQISDEIYKEEMLSAFTEVSNYYQSATDDNRAVYHQ